MGTKSLPIVAVSVWNIDIPQTFIGYSLSDSYFRMDVADTSVDLWIRCLGNDSLLQPLWDSIRLNYTDYLRSPLFPIVLTVSSYFVLCIPFLVCDIMGERWAWVQQFKIQPSRRPTASTLLHSAGVTLYKHVFIVLPASVAQWTWRPPVDLPEQAPSLLELIAGLISNLLLTSNTSSGTCSITGSTGCMQLSMQSIMNTHLPLLSAWVAGSWSQWAFGPL